MNTIELANYELSFSFPGKKAVEVRKTGRLECEIVLSDGSIIKANGLIAFELNKSLDKEKNGRGV
jgi:hypothetical protein